MTRPSYATLISSPGGRHGRLDEDLRADAGRLVADLSRALALPGEPVPVDALDDITLSCSVAGKGALYAALTDRDGPALSLYVCRSERTRLRLWQVARTTCRDLPDIPPAPPWAIIRPSPADDIGMMIAYAHTLAWTWIDKRA